ncbi:DUF3631 domain-containing protein [Pengzhenrongella sp.]|jgi:hypothetical protein|uniref:DUF3631 domain-containing protein n=1 Tax=Pengzhenrongella sp. TaxID=2888820 RepID=UPI002F925B8E
MTQQIRPTTQAAPQDDAMAVNGAELLDEVAAALGRYVILPSHAATVAVVLWIAASHAVPAWHCAPRLVIRAPEKRCGKSRLLDLVEAMCHRSLMTTNASPSAVYRSIGMTPTDPPTLLIDEADAIFGPKAGDNEDLRGLLNAGHQRGRPALRYDAGSKSVDHIATFAMVALAGIGAMPDTIEDRAVVIRMRRRAPGEDVQPYRVRRDGPSLVDLKDRLNQWVRANLDALTNAVPVMTVEDRIADTWEPLTAVADLAGGDWPDNVRDAVLTLTADRDANTAKSTRTRLLTDCRTAFADADALPTADLLDRLRGDPEAPWATYGHAGLTAMRLGILLREFDITSRNMRLPTGQAKGYGRSDFTDAWARYCPTDPVGEGEPSQPSQASLRRSERDGLPARDGLSRPAVLSRPGADLQWDGWDGWDGLPPNTHPVVCITCRQALSYDDGTHTHPNCATAAEPTG